MNAATLALGVDQQVILDVVSKLRDLGLGLAMNDIWPDRAREFHQIPFATWLLQVLGQQGDWFLKELGQRLSLHKEKYWVIWEYIKGCPLASKFGLHSWTQMSLVLADPQVYQLFVELCTTAHVNPPSSSHHSILIPWLESNFPNLPLVGTALKQRRLEKDGALLVYLFTQIYVIKTNHLFFPHPNPNAQANASEPRAQQQAQPQLPELPDQDEVDEKRAQCITCCERVAKVTLSCGHMQLCCQCYNKIRTKAECPTCRKKITMAVITYYEIE